MKSLLLSLALITAPVFACDIDGQTGFMPENDLNISVDAKSKNTMTEKRFNAIIDKVEKVYKPIVKKRGAILKVSRKWKDGTVNASAQQFWKLWVVNMYGGLARHQLVTDDGFALVVCHELGHHIGGAPKYNGNMWASNEGQADYFGSLKCFRRVFRNDDNINIVSKMEIDPMAEEKCRAQWANEEDAALCMRASMAGLSLAKLLGSLRGRADVQFKTPDRSVVTRTNDAHPAAQCRLDTYFNGTLCDKPYTEDVDKRDASKGTCMRAAGYTEGARPRCWYAPAAN